VEQSPVHDRLAVLPVRDLEQPRGQAPQARAARPAHVPVNVARGAPTERRTAPIGPRIETRIAT